MIINSEYRAWLMGIYDGKMVKVTSIDFVGTSFVPFDPYITVDSYCDLISLSDVILMKNLHICDKNGKTMYENDITELKVNEETRRFIVKEKEIEREVKVIDDFVDELQKMRLKTIVFEYEGHDLLPCIDEQGICDIEKMKIIGNVFENPELIKNDR